MGYPCKYNLVEISLPYFSLSLRLINVPLLAQYNALINIKPYLTYSNSGFISRYKTLHTDRNVSVNTLHLIIHDIYKENEGTKPFITYI